MATTYTFLIAANVAVWVWALVVLAGHPTLWALAILAYIFGLRHAFDTDHIVAIDNVVRRLLSRGKTAFLVGLFFSLGHATVVVLACAVVARASAPLRRHLEILHDIGGVFGTFLSAGFLLSIGVANLFVLRSIWTTFQRTRCPQRNITHDPLQQLPVSGFLVGLCRPLLQLVSSPWHMYPVGLLFGLGFDTATEIGLLSISAQGSIRGISFSNVLVLPALFTAAMALFDTTDSHLMTRVYGWAFIHPLRKLWYNLTLTAASAIVALGVGSIQAVATLSGKLALQGGIWHLANALNENLPRFGYLVVAIFLASWIVSIAIYKVKQYDRLALE